MNVAVVGTGYVGLVTGACLALQEHQVTCVDVLRERVEAINRGETPFLEPGLSALIQRGLQHGCLRATTDLAQAIQGNQIAFIAVGTPQHSNRIDLSYVKTASEQIGGLLRRANRYQVVVVKSTVIPGTTETLVRQALEKTSGLQVGEFGLCVNPEFLREGSAVADFMEPDRIVIGEWDERSGDLLSALYETFECPKLRTNLSNAEMTKYASNSLLAMLVSFSNEIASLCEALPATDAEIVMEGVHLDRRLSPLVAGRRLTPGILSYLRAGAGFGGSCLPKDVNALRGLARDLGVGVPLIDAVMQVNEGRPKQIVAILEEILGGLQGQAVAVLGLAFKPGTDDLRASPALKIVDELLKKGAMPRAYDPLAVPKAEGALREGVLLCTQPEAALNNADGLIVTTAWPEFADWNWTRLCSFMRRPLILDARNALRKVEWPPSAIYRTIGVGPVRAK
jgi:UDPglucose 6-dehydrogenase/GDP-mannose 6-dehydrogenase